MAKAKPKRGPLSICRSRSLISQVVLKHRSYEAVLEIRTMGGEVLLSQELPEPPATHKLLPDGRSVLLAHLARFDDDPDISYALHLLDMETGEKQPVGRASNFRVAVGADRLACFRGDSLTVTSLQGSDFFSIEMPHDEEYQALAFLPDSRLAVSTGAGGDMLQADVAILNADTGAVEARYESQVASSYNSFAPAVLAADPRGAFIALAGHHSGLVIFDLASGANVADHFAPRPLDLAEGHAATHDHHHYADIAFDDSGGYLAAACHPGQINLWTREGEAVLCEEPFLNPKASRLIAFDGSDLVYFDSIGDSARFALPIN